LADPHVFPAAPQAAKMVADDAMVVPMDIRLPKEARRVDDQ
jgi:hypothetical protein